MRMDPKHQFAAQIMLSRAAAERRDQIEKFSGIGQNSRGHSPASDTSSCGARDSPQPDHHNHNSSMIENVSDNNNNNGVNSLGSGNYNGKMSVNEVNSHFQAIAAAAQAAQNQNCNSDVATSAAAIVNLM